VLADGLEQQQLERLTRRAASDAERAERMNDGKAQQSNKTVYVTIGVLLLLLGVGSALGEIVSKSQSAPPPPPPAPLDNARAVLLAGDDGVTRTVVVAPCNTPVAATKREVAAGRPAPNAVTVELPADPEGRAVLVPDCLEASAGATASGSLPAAAFVLPIGTEAAENKVLQIGAQTQVIVPGGSPVRTVIVPPCSGTPAKPAPGNRGEQDVVLSPASGTDTATAPEC